MGIIVHPHFFYLRDLLHSILFYFCCRPLIDDDENEEFQKFLDELDDEDDENDENTDEPDVQQFIRGDAYIRDYPNVSSVHW